MRPTALVDADILCYRVGFTTQNDEAWIARARMKEALERIDYALGSPRLEIYLTSSDKSNFRYQISPDYKANRTQPKPKHFYYLRDYLINEKEAIVVEGQEADDAIGIAASSAESIIVTIDKDLDQIPGDHYNFVQEKRYTISPMEANRSFFHQVLVGDRTDNVKGCPKVGEVKSARYLEGCENERQMMEVVVREYKEAYDEGEWQDKLLLAGNLLWIRRKPLQPWEFDSSPVSKEVLESISKSME